MSNDSFVKSLKYSGNVSYKLSFGGIIGGMLNFND